VIAELKSYLDAAGCGTVVTREPGGIAIAEQIRSVILDRANTGMDAKTEALLYAAARRQHLVEKVIPALQRNQTILCDRFIDSSLAYQGYARGLGMDEVYAINQFAVDGRMPDLTLLLDLDPETGLARIRGNQNREVNRLDMEQLDFHRRVREGYRLLAERNPARIKVVDASRPLAEVAEEARKIISVVLGIG